MKSLKPWGETPLYLSVVQARRPIRRESRGTRRALFVDHRTAQLSIQFAESETSRRRHDGRWADHKIPGRHRWLREFRQRNRQAAKEFGALAEQNPGKASR